MPVNLAGAGIISSAGTTVASLDAAGVLTHANRPMCLVTQTAGATAVGSDIIFNLVGYNVGNHYNAANGRFTAPISAVYHVMYRQLSLQNSASQSYVMALYLNGNLYSYSWTAKPAAGYWNSHSFRALVYIPAGDYCTLRYYEGNQALHADPGYTQYSIQMVA